MDTMSAFLKGEEARLRGNKMMYYDVKKAIELMQTYKVKKATLGTRSDWGYTAQDVTLKELKEHKKENKITVAGIQGSIWDEPCIEIAGSMIPCYYTEEE